MAVDVMSEMECRRKFLEHRAAFSAEALDVYSGRWIAWSPDGSWRMPTPRRIWMSRFVPPEKIRNNAWSRAFRDRRNARWWGMWSDGIVRFPYVARPTRHSHAAGGRPGPALRELFLKMQTNLAKEAILDRIKTLEDAIAKGLEYLESGAHADWHGFKAFFATKTRNGKVLPPHKDWVKNVFLPTRERALVKSERLLERLTLEEQKKHS